ncbi:MAG: sensor histidine kinase, partial [Planctomycetota bacterium]
MSTRLALSMFRFTGSRLALGTTLFVALGAILAGVRSSEAESRYCLAQSALVEQLELERSLGYGGLIHNFKNALLRPDEPVYLDRARENAADVLTHLDELGRLVDDLGAPSDLDQTRAAVASYGARLDRIVEHEGWDPRQLDALVRLDDRGALEEVHELVENVVSAASTELNSAQRTALLTRWMLVLIAGLSAWSLRSRSVEEKHAEQLRRVNSSLKDTNQSLLWANEHLDRAAAMASHDFRGPMRRIVLLASMLEEDRDFVRSEQAAQDLDSLKRSTLELERSFEKVLSNARAGLRNPNVEPIEPYEALKAAMRWHRATIDECDAWISVESLPGVVADPELLQRVFGNLIENAIKYRRPGVSPRIRIAAIEVDGEVRFSVEDNGRGIPIDKHEQVFEWLHRGEPEGDGSSTGSGIGLANVSAILTSMDGRIWIDPDWSVGTRFCFALPASE